MEKYSATKNLRNVNGSYYLPIPIELVREIQEAVPGKPSMVVEVDGQKVTAIPYKNSRRNSPN